MPVLKQIMGRLPSAPKGRVRNYIANAHLGTTHTDIHENIINPGVMVPWHLHATEEVIVVLEGQGEYLTQGAVEPYREGDVLIIPARVKHALRNTGDRQIRQICVFPDDPKTERLEPEYPGQTVEVFNEPS